jgi:hypothetical protein
MNGHLTERMATRWFSIRDEPDKLLELPPSDTMESTGNVFNPEYFMIDRESKIVYRKEQFSEGSSLPAELIVRDRRFTREEIESLCREAGLTVLWSRLVRAGAWEIGLQETDNAAKEILVLCSKP